MGSAFNPQILMEKLAKLNASQQSIETLSHWCIFHMNKAKQVVETWDRQFHCSPREQRLAFLYLANDILQNSRRKGAEFVGEFWKVLPDALRDVIESGDDFGKNAALRLISIWEERKVFGSRGQILKDEFVGRQPDTSNRNGKPTGLKLQRQSAGNALDKIVSSYQLVYGGQLDEESLLNKCKNTISSIDKVDKEFGGDLRSGHLNGAGILDELKGQHSTLRECVEQLTSLESSRANLVTHLREALQEQEYKLDQVRNQLQAAHNLKPCFLYFGSFPGDEKIRVNDLIILWISEGFIEKHETKSLEVVANEYLMDLVGRSLVIALRRSSTGRIKTCIVHDLLREFCLAKGKEENVFQVFDGNKDSNNLHYRICIQDNCWSSFLRHENGSAAPFVHSLLPFPKDHWRFHCQILEPENIRCLATYFRFLQVLFLCSNVSFYDFPEAITELVLLKCLIIVCALFTVPPSIKKLANLETLIFEQYSFYTETDFPLMAVLEMQKLRHLFVRGRCDPTGFQNNKHPISPALRTFSCTGLQLPYERSEMFFRKLPNVQTLKCQIKSPYSLREEPKLILKLDYLSRLEALRVHYRTLADKLASFELQFPNTLKKLHLLNFSLPWSSISAAISRLPNLEVLKLDGGFFGETWNVEDHEFQTLKFLRLKNLPIEEFNASDDSFPCLQHFVVDGCEDLQEIPIRFASISTLKIIEVNRHLESSARYIEEEQKDLGNDLEVRIS